MENVPYSHPRRIYFSERCQTSIFSWAPQPGLKINCYNDMKRNDVKFITSFFAFKAIVFAKQMTEPS